MADSFHPLAKANPKDESMNRDENSPAPPSCLPNDSKTSRNRRFSTSAVPSPTLKGRRQLQKRSSGEFVRRVSFDTMTHQDMPNYSFTLQEKSSGWERTQKTRVFMLATDLESHSREALKYTTERLLEDGDEIVVVRVADIQAHKYMLGISENLLQEQAIRARRSAESLMQYIKETQNSNRINIVLEFVIGRTQDSLEEMLHMYQPSALVVGTQGKSPLKSLVTGSSVSRFCLRRSPVPVIVVKDTSAISPSSSSQRSSSTSSTEGGQSNGDTLASKWKRRLSLTNRASK
ncbi:hypothetical protein NQZ79_g8745 [Umbelopsis isabellina]|nr:hypothetical protein NQZ79_g8745 [Umbelopsis isabellina]